MDALPLWPNKEDETPHTFAQLEEGPLMRTRVVSLPSQCSTGRDFGVKRGAKRLTSSEHGMELHLDYIAGVRGLVVSANGDVLRVYSRIDLRRDGALAPPPAESSGVPNPWLVPQMPENDRDRTHRLGVACARGG